MRKKPGSGPAAAALIPHIPGITPLHSRRGGDSLWGSTNYGGDGFQDTEAVAVGFPFQLTTTVMRIVFAAPYSQFGASLRLLLPFAAFLVALIPAAFARPWPAVEPADLAATESTSHPGADLEILFSRHILDDDDAPSSMLRPAMGSVQRLAWTMNHVRAKIYTQKGVEKSSVLKFEYVHDTRIRNVSARVVKPDGTATELEKSNVYETSVVKWSGTQIKSTSFAFPNLAPGDVVEYRWQQMVPDDQYFILHCQQAAPVREFTFHVNQLSRDYNLQWFNCPGAKLTNGNGYAATFQVNGLKPFEEEDFMPAEKDFRAWLLVLFTDPFLRHYSAKEIWQEIGMYFAEEYRLATRPNGDIKNKAAELTAGAATDLEKLSRLYDFCQTNISNFDWFKSPELILAEEKRDKRDYPPSAADVLSLKTGNTNDVNRLFAGLARAAGFEVRYARSASRDEFINVEIPKGYLFIPNVTVAVKVGEAWQFYSPGHYTVPFGMLRARDEAVRAFVCDEKKPWFQQTQITPPANSLTKRKGRFAIDAEGTLTGEVQMEFSGHPGMRLKNRWWGDKQDDATNDVREQLAKRLPTAEISDVVWENLGNRTYPVTLSFKVTVPGYAEAAGSRLIFPTNFFEAGMPGYFTQDSRSFPIFFPYPERELDDVQVKWPEGYVQDSVNPPTNVGDADGFITARYGLGLKPKARVVVLQREFVLGGNNAIAFRAESYGVIKGLLDKIATADNHRIMIKPKPVEAAAGESTQSGTAKATP